ncbi:MAG: hypothetical protein MI924_11905 [Chloroflexales bacterium]|nr:hypothetical protein [Chloroflexales bacterium]
MALLPSHPLAILRSELFSRQARGELLSFMLRLGRGVPPSLQAVSVQNWLDQTIRDPMVRQFIQTFIRLSTYTNAPTLQSAGAALEMLQMALLSNVLYLDGGWQTIVDTLLAQVRSAGVTLHSSSRVASVEYDTAARGVRLADGILDFARKTKPRHAHGFSFARCVRLRLCRYRSDCGAE